MHPTKNSLPLEIRGQVAIILNQTLADLGDLYSQTKQAHWNVRGRLFYPLHKLFDYLADSLPGHMDDIAERVTALGGAARGTVRQAAARSQLLEFPDGLQEDLDYLFALRDRFALAANNVRHAIEESARLGDAGTVDLFTAISRELDKALWMLEAHSP